MEIAVLDLGSNSFHLLVARLGDGGALQELDDCKRMVRLAASRGLDGALDAAGFSRGLEAAELLVRRACPHAGVHLVGVATAAIREAPNGAAFLEAVRSRTGLAAEIVTGEEEARLSWAGARSALPADAGRVAVVDVGGGSVQLAIGEGDSCLLARSAPIGVLRLKATYAPESGPLEVAQIRAIAAAVRRGAERTVRALRALAPDKWVFSSGTARALRRLARRKGTSGAPSDRLRLVTAMGLAADLTQLGPAGAEALGAEPERADTIATGAVVVATLMDLCDVPDVIVSSRALREGVALREWNRARCSRAARAASNAKPESAGIRRTADLPG
jgi:exopolyphosphatase/guanosine-5'-triphosphate,3'-diphosphate pyrophosphatase